MKTTSLIMAGLSVALFSPLTWATAASQARTSPVKKTGKYVCEMEMGKQGQVLEETTQSATLLLDQDGESMTMTLPQTDSTVEVLVQYYKSPIEDNGVTNERIQISINNLQTDEQEDYLSTKIKPLLYVTELSGSFKDQNNNTQNFDSITVQCYPEN